MACFFIATSAALPETISSAFGQEQGFSDMAIDREISRIMDLDYSLILVAKEKKTNKGFVTRVRLDCEDMEQVASKITSLYNPDDPSEKGEIILRFVAKGMNEFDKYEYVRPIDHEGIELDKSFLQQIMFSHIYVAQWREEPDDLGKIKDKFFARCALS